MHKPCSPSIIVSIHWILQETDVRGVVFLNDCEIDSQKLSKNIVAIHVQPFPNPTNFTPLVSTHADDCEANKEPLRVILLLSGRVRLLGQLPTASSQVMSGRSSQCEPITQE